jgi:signal transduction histidine kinase/CheY-like chemotaxis protein
MKHEGTPVNLRSREGLVLLFALGVVLGIAFLSYRSWAASGRHADQVEVTQGTVSGVNALLLAVTNAETGQRGFLLTGEERYLEPYRQARVDIPVLLESLRRVAVARADQAQRIESLRPLIDEKLAELALTIELRQTRGFDAALAVVRTDRGRALMGRMRGICREILAVTNARLAEYSQQVRSSGDEGALIAILGCACLFLLLLVANITIQRGVARRQSLIGELQESELRLESVAVEAQTANRAKSTFLSTMSHEIRTPMNVILGYSELMLRDPGLGAKAKANLELIGRSGEHLMGLINDILDMSKIEAGRTELTPLTFNLTRLLDDLAAMFRVRAEAKSLGFEMLVDGESVPYAVADEGKMRQVLINLLGNAIKFTGHGQIRMRITLEHKNGEHKNGESESGGQLWLSARVEDTGSGLTEEEQSKLFEPFTQTSRGAHSQEGTGLGLAISRKYARLMGGDITVSSNRGHGSIFHFAVPIARGDTGVSIQPSAVRRVLAIQKGQEAPRVLVADDHAENRDWLMKLLTSIGFSVQVADNGEAAVRKWEQWNPQLILMDVHMPVMDGLEATRRIKGDARGKETAIVVLTASALDEDRRTASLSGADDFLAKPCREDQLLEKMRALLHVTYEYEELGGNEGQPVAGVPALSAEKLRQLPRDVIEELRSATAGGSKRRLDQLILKVRETEDAESADALQELANKYEYDTLSRLLEEARRP